MRINQNIAAFNAYRNLSITTDQQSKSLEKLSSGFRINRAADDAAGLMRSESLRAEIGGTKVAIRNAQDAISFVQTAEGALNEVHSILQRMRDLAVGASNATSDGTAEQAEFEQLVEELAAIGARTTFAGEQVFNNAARTFQVGAQFGDGAAAADHQLEVDGMEITTVTGNLETGANTALAAIDAAIQETSDLRSDLGAKQNRLESTIRNLSVAAENLSAAESRIRDTDMADEMVAFTRHQILQQAGTAMLAQANQVPQSVLALLR